MTSPYAPAIDPAVQKLRKVRDLASLVTYLHEELEWPVAEYDFEDLVYDVTPQEAGLDATTEAKVRSIKRLRPLTNDQPWGIFFIDFVPGDLPITVLRRILRAVSIKKREQGRADRKAWQTDDLLFISVLGEEGDRDLNLAHFTDDPAAKRATLRVVEWDAADTAFAILRTHNELQNLAWRRDGETDEEWRERWAKAFALRPREVAHTAKALASQMAQLAKLIRGRVNEAIAVESKDGPLRQLHEAFREVLLHDLTEDGFADMYAQTMTYGLFAARNSRPSALTLDTAVEMIPNTNPFLRDLLGQFTTASGLTTALDFDELGVDALIDALERANMEAVVADFGRAKPDEDPVIHFYEDFLREYNKKQKIQRGVFYTPKPVVSFIVRSVHELLQTEFQLPDGLASTETWGDMVAKFPELEMPEGATPGTPFVQVLDPACGTGTFLVEVIQLIHDTMTAKWAKQGIKHGSFEWQQAWNEYVAKHLLPRIYGFEIMMASYTIAHMKVGLKLGELGYKFAAAERLRIYLTNTLEPPQDFRGMFDIMAPALAHEARAVNEVKQGIPFTVVVGNPPYSVSSRNQNAWILGLTAGYKAAVRHEKNLQPLSDDYVKFTRFAEHTVETAKIGILGFITNHTWLTGLLFAGMRKSLSTTFPRRDVIDLRGSTLLGDTAGAGIRDENVFDIQQGVSILLGRAAPANPAPHLGLVELRGSRASKFEILGQAHLSMLNTSELLPRAAAAPISLSGDHKAEYLAWPSVADVFRSYSTGFETGRDSALVAFTLQELESLRSDLIDPTLPDAAFSARYGISDTSGWPVVRRRREAQRLGASEIQIRHIAYRPFDWRFTVYCDFLRRAQFANHGNLLSGDVLALVTSRMVKGESFAHCFVTNAPTEKIFLSPRTSNNAYVFCALISDSRGSSSNVAAPFEEWARKTLTSADPHAVLAYVFAVLSSPGFVAAYHDALTAGFPRVPFSSNSQLSRRLEELGRDLTSVVTFGRTCSARIAFDGERLVDSASPRREDDLIRIGKQGFVRGVSDGVWHFRVGGYQPAQKWLKDRRGRVLTDEDIEHYKRIIGAIEETIRIQKEIDEVIEAHGGWPAAFQGGEAE